MNTLRNLRRTDKVKKEIELYCNTCFFNVDGRCGKDCLNHSGYITSANQDKKIALNNNVEGS
jgi:hypothetical protein